MIRDETSDIFNDYLVITAENLAEKYNISREEQDAFAAQSQNRTEEAQITGKAKDEIVPFSIPQRKEPIIVDKDRNAHRAGVTDRLYCQIASCL